MSNFLKENQKEDIRYQDKDIILYNPNEDEYNTLKEIMKNVVTDKNKDVNIDVKYIKEIFRILVKDGNFVDDYTDEELIKELNNGNRRIQLLYQEITNLIQEIIDDILYECIKQAKDINTLLNMANSNEDATKIKEKIDKFLKKKKIKVNLDEIEKIFQENPETIKNIVEQNIK